MEKVHVLVGRNEVYAFVKACRELSLEFVFLYESHRTGMLFYRVYVSSNLVAYQLGREFGRRIGF